MVLPQRRSAAQHCVLFVFHRKVLRTTRSFFDARSKSKDYLVYKVTGDSTCSFEIMDVDKVVGPNIDYICILLGAAFTTDPSCNEQTVS